MPAPESEDEALAHLTPRPCGAYTASLPGARRTARRTAPTCSRSTEAAASACCVPGSGPPGLLPDTTVVLDLALKRLPWGREAALLLDAVVRGRARGFIAAHAVTTVYYVVEKGAGRTAAVTAVGDVLSILEVVPLGEAEFHRALALGLKDFADAVHVAACLRAGADYLVTRSRKDFRGGGVTIRTPGEVLALLPP